MTIDYTAGIGHCKNKVAVQGRPTIYEANLIIAECEGKAVTGAGIKRNSPNPRDVFYSLAADSDVLDYPAFEDWASCFGYDTDSRKAEEIYKICLECTIKLRVAIGEGGLMELKAVYQDY
jgi:hypothetical protein